MPKARAPNAPCVAVWLSPQTIVMPGCVIAQLRADDVNDALLRTSFMSYSLMPNSWQFGAAFRPAAGRSDRQSAASGRSWERCGRAWRRQLRPADLAAGQAQALERLRAGHFMDEVQIDVEDRLLAGFGMNDVAVPDLLEHGAR